MLFRSPRFLGLWGQIAARYAGWPGRLYFELLNEPRAAMTARAWNELIPPALAVIRERDPGRAVIVGPARMNDIGALPVLELPDDDRLVVTVHYYAPFEFTHQGAPWRAGADQCATPGASHCETRFSAAEIPFSRALGSLAVSGCL